MIQRLALTGVAVAALYGATPAAAADFTLVAGTPVTFAVTRTGFLATLTAQAAESSPFQAILSFYDFSGCPLPDGGCVPVDPNRSETVNLIAGPRATTTTFAISAGTGRGPFGPITLTFLTTSLTPITITRLSADSAGIPSVPEPATWALMFAGFAMTGYALRRRRAAVAFA